MFAPDSPLLNIPATLHKRQAVFLDGLRQHAQIALYAYTRLCQSLSELAHARDKHLDPTSDYTAIFLDAWACVEAIDRFRQLWQLQPAADTIPKEFSPSSINQKLNSIRNIRNVSAHIAQKIDQITSLNSSVSGTISWATVLSKEPLVINTHFVRPGVIHGHLQARFAMPTGDTLFTHDTGHVVLAACQHEGDLSQGYQIVVSIIEFAERHLSSKFSGKSFEPRLPTNVFGSARLDT